MKKYLNNFSFNNKKDNRVINRSIAMFLLMIAFISGYGQEPYIFTEGSVHKFMVPDNPANTFAWSMYINPYNDQLMDPSSYELSEKGKKANLTIKFNDMNRRSPELVYLVVSETTPTGCSTRRAIQIQLEPNNMYLEFASANSQDCYSKDDYYAPLKVGLNFNDKAKNVPIPESLFPLTLKYTIQNITEGTPAVEGNGGKAIVMAFASDNNYSLQIPEAVGRVDRTTDYELVITTVRDKYETEITGNQGDNRSQRRVIIHLPQSGKMDMAMALAYVISTSDIQYLGMN